MGGNKFSTKYQSNTWPCPSPRSRLDGICVEPKSCSRKHAQLYSFMSVNVSFITCAKILFVNTPTPSATRPRVDGERHYVSEWVVIYLIAFCSQVEINSVLLFFGLYVLFLYLLHCIYFYQQHISLHSSSSSITLYVRVKSVTLHSQPAATDRKWMLSV